MHLNDKQRRILVGVLRDRQRLANTPAPFPEGMSRRAVGSERLKARMARDGLVPMNLGGWIGHLPTASETVMYCREYQRLEGLGLIERHNSYGGHRTSHLRLTEAGEQVAQVLLAEEDLPDEHWRNMRLLPIELPPGDPSQGA